MKKVVPRFVALYRHCRGYFLFHGITPCDAGFLLRFMGRPSVK
ncbi:MAG: hypothetical protein PT947_00465 [Suipraeoptans intestinalis]|nr:hypothetical protein [Suipraeoptans intestinalis]